MIQLFYNSSQTRKPYYAGRNKRKREMRERSAALKRPAKTPKGTIA